MSCLNLKITFKQRDSQIWEILVDGEKWKEVHRSIFGKRPLFPSLSDIDRLQETFNQFEYHRVKKYVLWRLSKQSYHSLQLKKLLIDRLVQSETLEQVLQEYQESGLLNDENWLTNFIGQHQKRHGMRFILQKLYSKGISKAVLKDLGNQLRDRQEEEDSIKHLLSTRYRTYDLSQYKIRQKVLAALIRKGFEFEMIMNIIKSKN